MKSSLSAVGASPFSPIVPVLTVAAGQPEKNWARPVRAIAIPTFTLFPAMASQMSFTPEVTREKEARVMMTPAKGTMKTFATMATREIL